MKKIVSILLVASLITTIFIGCSRNKENTQVEDHNMLSSGIQETKPFH